MAKAAGSIWIEGNTLRYVSASGNEWSYAGTFVKNQVAASGSCWIDDYLYFINEAGNQVYRVEGTWTGGYPAGQYVGMGSIWVEAEFVRWLNHIGAEFWSHADYGSHGDGVTHVDTPHADSHGDSHSDTAGHADSHSDVAHSDTSHSDSHTNTAHSDSHGDVEHTDGQHTDYHLDTGISHYDGAAHSDSHQDYHTDVEHYDGHTDTHNDGYVAHIDSGAQHSDSHSDSAHGDSHSDRAHVDKAHSDTHSDAAHGDSHSDTAHQDTAHVDHSDSVAGVHTDQPTLIGP